MGTLLPIDALSCAIRGDLVGGSPLVGWARELGDLYSRAIHEEDAIPQVRYEIARFVGDIDAWLTARLPRPRPGVQRGLDSGGAVIARVAAATAEAYWALRRLDGEPLHRVWTRLAEIGDAYSDFVVVAESGRIILPSSHPPDPLWSTVIHRGPAFD